MRQLASIVAGLLIGSAFMLQPQVAHGTPCPPLLLGEHTTSPDGSVCSSPSDSRYGSQIFDGQCPGIPSSFPRVYEVASSTEFDAAYAAARPGEAIIVRNGTYSGDSSLKILNRSGTSTAPIYILAQSLHGVDFRGGLMRFRIEGGHNVVAGFRWTNPGAANILTVSGPDNRIACNVAVSGGAAFVVTESSGGADRLLVDNNVLDNLDKGLVFNRCNPALSSCTKNSTDIHVRHNTFRNRPRDPDTTRDHEAIQMGLGYFPVEGTPTYNPDGNDMRMIVENNLFDGWNGEEELITVKSSRNIIRNNCIRNAPDTYIVVRLGDNNLITGNWQEGGRGAHRVSGKGNYFVFNYQAKRTAGSYAFRPHQGNRNGYSYVYRQGSDNVWRYNVFANFSGWIQVRDRLGGVYVDSPRGNHFSDNLMFSTSFSGNDSPGTDSYSNVDGTWTESQFRAYNYWGANTVAREALPASQCGNPDLFSGPGGATAVVPRSPDLLYPGDIGPPSWWR